MEVLKEDLIRQARYMPRAIILMPILLLAILFIKNNNKEQIMEKICRALKDYRLMLFLLWMAFILMSTIFSRWPKKPYGNVMNGFGFMTSNVWNKESIENVVFFIPYTFLFLWTFKPQKPWKAALILSFISTVTIELLQLIFWLGAFQFSDILHNLEGGIIGCGFWYAVKLIKEKRAVRTM